MQNCCYCFKLRNGTIASALYILITRAFLLISCSIILAFYHIKPLSYWDQENSDDHLIRFLVHLLIIKSKIIDCLGPIIAESVLIMIFSLLLGYAVTQNKKQLFLPWMILMAVEIAAEITGATVCIALSEIYKALAPVILLVNVFLFNSYLLHCVLTYYKSLPGCDASHGETPTSPQISSVKPCVRVHSPA